MTAYKSFTGILKKSIMLIAVLTFMVAFFALANNVFAVDIVSETEIIDTEEAESEMVSDPEETVIDTDDKSIETTNPTDESVSEEKIVLVDENTSEETTIPENLEESEDDVDVQNKDVLDEELPSEEPEAESVENVAEEIPVIAEEANDEAIMGDSEYAAEKPVLLKSVAAPQVMALSVAQDTPELKQAKVIIRSVEKGTNKVLSTKEIEGTVGAMLTVAPEKIKGYKAEKGSASIIVNDKTNSITFLYNAVKEPETTKPVQKNEVKTESTTEYIKKGVESIVKINYIDANGKKLLSSKEIKSISGNKFTAYAEEIEGYSATKQKETLTVKETNNAINFIYEKNDTKVMRNGTSADLSESETIENPKTGDNTMAVLCVAMLIFSVGAAVLCKKKYDYLIKD